MPVDDIVLKCDIFLCIYNFHHNNQYYCNNDCHCDKLNPNKSDCSEFSFHPEYHSKLFSSEKDVKRFLDLIKEIDIPFLSLDENSKQFQTVMAVKGDYCLIQGDEPDVMQFNFWKNVDGGFGYTHKSQLSLEI